jgi:hypothetical protein
MRPKSKAEIEAFAANCIVIEGMSESDARETAARWAAQRHPLKEYSYDELMAEDDAGWLVGDSNRPVLLADALWMDYGPEKGGKTYRDLEIAFCVAFGFKYYGLPVRQGNVAYIIAEGRVPRIRKRVHALGWKYGKLLKAAGYKNFRDVVDAGKFNLIGSPVNLTDPKADIGIPQLLDQLKHPPYVSLWMDTWARMLAASGGHSSDMDTVPLALRGCDYISEQLGCTTVLIAHTPLSDTGRPKGLNEQTGNIDGATRCEKVGSAAVGELFRFTSDFQRHGMNDYRQVFKQIELGPDRVFADEGGEFTDSKLKDRPRALAALNLLRKMDAGCTVTEWKAACKEAGLMPGKNTRQQWSEIKSTLLAVDAVEVDSATKMATARTATPTVA